MKKRVANSGSFTRERLLKHGLCESPTYQAWKDMKRRCTNVKAKNFHHYGGRGIKFCEAWRTFAGFLADMGVRPHGLTLERRNNNGNYEPGNCYWAPVIDQANNTRRNRFIEIDGRRQTISQWARERGVSRFLIRDRLDAGVHPVQAVMGVGNA